MSKALMGVALVGTVVLGGAGSCGGMERTPYREVELAPETEDCDAEDIAKKDWRDCPHLFQSPRPVQTARQPAPTKTKRR